MLPFKSKYRLFDLFGIPIYIDISFAILLLLLIGDFGSIDFGLTMALMLAVSITLHELGHSLTARVFGFPTTDITLSLLGGCASLIALPRKAYQELLTAVAGPLVSFLIAGFAYACLRFVEIPSDWLFQVLLYTCIMNMMLGLFNLLPALPMDGGRIFRSALRFFMTRLQATYIAMYVGRVCAVLLVVLPILGIRHIWFIPIGGSFILRLFIAIMIWKEAYREYVLARMEGSWHYQDFRAKVSPPPYDR